MHACYSIILKKIIFPVYLQKFQNFDLDSEISFNFEDVDGYIELCFDTVQCTKGWSVVPNEIPTKVSNHNNNYFSQNFYNRSVRRL